MGGGAGGSQLLFPLPTKEPLAVAPRGHRRHASFDPNTDCFSQHYSLGSGGGSGGGAASVVGRGDGSGRCARAAEAWLQKDKALFSCVPAVFDLFCSCSSHPTLGAGQKFFT